MRPSIRRLGDMVQMDIPALGLSSTNATSNTFFSLPLGFRPQYNYGVAGFLERNNTPVAVRFNLGGTIYAQHNNNPGQMAGQLQWRTTNPWPTSLPGVVV